MKVIVGDRQTGRTTKLIEWLSDGHEIRSHPGWSRVIVVHSQLEALQMTREVWAASQNWPDESLATSRMRGAIWSLADLQSVELGNRRLDNIEFVVDDLDKMLPSLFNTRKQPAIIVIEGSVYEQA